MERKQTPIPATRVRRQAVLLVVLLGLATAILYSPSIQSAVVVYSISEQRLPWSIRAYKSLFLWHAGTSLLLPAADGSAVASGDSSLPTTRVRMFFPIGKNDPPIIILAHGLLGRGIDDPLLVFVGSRLAEGGFRVILPEILSNADLRMREDALQSIGSAIHWAAIKYHQKVTVAAVSFAGGLTMTAAAQPRYAQDLKMVVVISGYNDLPRLADYYLGRPAFGPSGNAYPKQPPNLGPMLIAYQHLEDLVPAEDVVPLRGAMAGRYNDPYGVQVEAEAVKKLTPRQQTEYRDLCSDPSSAAKERMLRMVQKHASEWQAISPHGKLAHLQVPVYLIHGTKDIVVPLGEAEWTLSELPSTNPGHLLASNAMLHVAMNDHAPRVDRIRVGMFLADVLTAARQ